MIFNRGQGFNDVKEMSLIDYENVLNAGFKDVELIPLYEKDYYKNRIIFKEFLKKVPIIDEFSEENGDNKDYYAKDLEDDLLDAYIKDNTYNGKIRMLRRYYGIIARK